VGPTLGQQANQPQQQQEQPASTPGVKVGDRRPAVKSSAVAQGVKDMISKTAPTPANSKSQMAAAMRMKIPGQMSAIKTPGMGMDKPKPNDTAVSAEWYSNESNLSKK